MSLISHTINFPLKTISAEIIKDTNNEKISID